MGILLLDRPPLDPLLARWLTQVGGASSLVTRSLSDFLRAIRSDTSLALLDYLLPIAIDRPQQLVDIIGLKSLSLVNSPTLTPYQGLQGNGTSSYGDTNFNASTATNYQRLTAFAGVYVQTGETSGSGFHAYLGANGASVDDSPLIGRNTTNIFWDINHSTNSADSFAFASQVGFWGEERTGNTACQLYKDTTTAVASNVLPSQAVGNRTTFLLAQNNNGGGGASFTNAIISMVAFGKSGVMPLGFGARVKTCLQGIGGSTVFA